MQQQISFVGRAKYVFGVILVCMILRVFYVWFRQSKNIISPYLIDCFFIVMEYDNVPPDKFEKKEKFDAYFSNHRLLVTVCANALFFNVKWISEYQKIKYLSG